MQLSFRSIRPEVEYVFNYANASWTSKVGVDPVQNTRIVYDIDDHGELLILQILNYRGTGNEFSTIEAELVFEEIIVDTPNYKRVDLVYRLPDVNAYVLAGYTYINDEYQQYLTEQVTPYEFLPKI